MMVSYLELFRQFCDEDPGEILYVDLLGGPTGQEVIQHVIVATGSYHKQGLREMR